SAVLAGRTSADLVRNVFVPVLMTGVGYVVGFRIGNGIARFLGACLILLLFSYALAWVFALVGLSAPNPGTAQVMAFPILFQIWSAVLAGRTSADLVRNVFVLVLMTGVGYVVGFRIGNGIARFLGACLILLLFSYALAWVFALVGLSAPNPETAQVMAFPILF